MIEISLEIFIAVFALEFALVEFNTDLAEVSIELNRLSSFLTSKAILARSALTCSLFVLIFTNAFAIVCVDALFAVSVPMEVVEALSYFSSSSTFLLLFLLLVHQEV